MKKYYIKLILLFSCSLTYLYAQNGFIQSNEKFEWGAGILSFRAGHYRGSDQAKNYFFPLPYFVYNTTKVHAEPSIIRGTFYENDFFALKLSVIAGLNVESEENIARKGMEGLDYTFEVGPMLFLKLWQNQKTGHTLTLEVPLRQVFTTDFTYVDTVGVFSIPYLNFVSQPRDSLFGWGYEFSIGYMWGDQRYHNFYYGVNPIYGNAERPAYSSRPGYSGTQIALILNKRWHDFIFVPFIRYDNLEGTAFEDSPLIKTRSYVMGGVALFWLFGKHIW